MPLFALSFDPFWNGERFSFSLKFKGLNSGFAHILDNGQKSANFELPALFSLGKPIQNLAMADKFPATPSQHPCVTIDQDSPRNFGRQRNDAGNFPCDKVTLSEDRIDNKCRDLIY